MPDGRSKPPLREKVLPSTKEYRAVVGSIVVLAVTAVGVYRIAQGDQLSPLFLLIFAVVVLASVAGLYGRGTLRTAVEAVKSLNGEDEGEP